MNLDNLDIFIDVMNRGSFVDVARDREVAPSSISRAIAGLEDELGVRLFQRTTRKISPTAAGKDYFAKIDPLLADLREAAQSAHDIEKTPKGPIRITSSVSFGQHVLIPILREFLDLYPDITLDYVLTDRTVDLIGARIDVAIRHGRLENSSFIASKLTQSEYRVVASPEYLKKHGRPEKPQNVSEHQALLFALPEFKERWVFQSDDEEPEYVPINARFKISNGLALRDLALQGCGIALLANWMIDDDVVANTLIDLFPGYKVSAGEYDNTIWLVTPSRSYLPLKIRYFLDFVKSKV